ncbi:MAG: ABC transporter ATP-binding protein [Gammaproteobacteria bacterium]|nr:ABC transporter ATP-binding protein [Gammaproteobacteria bacterium]
MPALKISHLKKTYANGVQALCGIDLNVEEGDFFALLGPNGAGKTTAIGIVTSLIRKTSGSVSVFDFSIDEQFEIAKMHIGLVPQEFNCNIFEDPVTILSNQAGYYGISLKQANPRVERYLKQLDLWDKRHQPSRTLSGGMKRRLMIARALVHQPKLLILDEPTAGVDIEIRRSMWSFLTEINQQGTTIILTTHYLEEAEKLCRNVAIIDHGRIIEHGAMKDVLSKLHVETFLINTETILRSSISLDEFACRRIDDQTIEVDIEQGQHLNDLFAKLETNGILVTSLRNKANRLEELFLRLVDQGASADHDRSH